MAILQLSPVKIGQTGVQPASYKMLSTDNLATITAAGYIKQGQAGQFFNKNDLIDVIAQYGTSSAENAVLYVTISNGVITLNEDLPEGLGQAALKNVTDNAQPLVVSVSGATQVNHIAKFDDVNGTITDGGILGTAANKATSDNTLASVAAVSGATVVGNVASFESVSGTVEDSGLAVANIQPKSNIIAATTGNIGGGGAGPITVPISGLTSASVVVATINTSSNTVAVAKAIASINQFNVTFSGDPGANCELNYIVVVAPQ